MSTPRRILMVLPYYPPSLGGISNHSQEFARAMAAAGHQLKLLVPAFPGMVRMPDEPGIELIYYPAREIIPNYPLPYMWSPVFWRALKQATRQPSDIVISRTRFFLSSFMAWCLAKFGHRKWIHVEHGSAFVRVGNPIVNAAARLYDELLGRLVLVSSDEVISISEDVQNFVRRFRAQPTPLIFRGLDIDSYEQVAANETVRQLYPGKVLIAWAGRMYRWKGVQTLVQSIACLPESAQRQVHGIIIGDGEDRADIIEAAKGLPITCLPAMDRSSVIATLKSTDIFVHASFPGGGLSTSLLEAMYCGNAIIATPNEGARSVIHHRQTGWLLSGTDASEMSGALQQLVEDAGMRRQMAAAGRQRVSERFAWAGVVTQYEAVIESVITQ